MAKKDDTFAGKKKSNPGHSSPALTRDDPGTRDEEDIASQGKEKPAWLTRSSSDPSYAKWSEKYDHIIAGASKGTDKSTERRNGETEDDRDDAENAFLRSRQHSPLASDDDFTKLSSKIDQSISSTANKVPDDTTKLAKSAASPLNNKHHHHHHPHKSPSPPPPKAPDAKPAPTVREKASHAKPANIAASANTTEAQAEDLTSDATRASSSVKLDEHIFNLTQQDEARTAPIDLTDESIAEKTKMNANTIAGKESASSEEDITVKATPEELNQLEQEMTIDTNVDRCIVCKKELAGDVFICPNCKNAKYHKDCIEALVANGEPCWVCQTHIVSEQAEKEVKALQLRLNYITKALEDLSSQFKGGQITEDTFTDTYNQFKQDKDGIEKQISAKLKKEPQPTDNE